MIKTKTIYGIWWKDVQSLQVATLVTLEHDSWYFHENTFKQYSTKGFTCASYDMTLFQAIMMVFHQHLYTT